MLIGVLPNISCLSVKKDDIEVVTFMAFVRRGHDHDLVYPRLLLLLLQ
jgi:hypothetical protein